jgi:uncharacterized LabA/DUF88 family protein
MKNIDEEKKMVVLIDADNAQYSRLSEILKEISGYGHIITRRAYGDWSSEYLKNWKTHLNELAIQPVQQFAYTTGKNSTDASLIIDAMDLLYTEKYDVFVIISSDSDFTKLASRLRESEVYVIGVGEKKTPTSFRNSCDEFMLVENLGVKNASSTLSTLSKKSENNIPQSIVLTSENENEESAFDIEKTKEIALSPREYFEQSKEEIVDLLTKFYSRQVDTDGWANVAAIPTSVRRMKPDFDSRSYGFPRVQDMIREMSDQFEITKKVGKNNVNIVVFRPVGEGKDF